MSPEKIESFPLAAGLNVRIGYADAHVEIAYKAHRFVPEFVFRVEASDLAAVPVIFGKAMDHAAKVKEDPR